MELMVAGIYEQPPQLKRVSSVYTKIPASHAEGVPIPTSSVEVMTTFRNHTSKKIQLNPVYVTEDTNELVYNSMLMEKGKKYRVTWNDEHFLLISNDDGVSVCVFEEASD